MTSLHRLLVPSDALLSQAPALSGEAARHVRALRPREGERFEFFDGAGRVRTYRYEKGAFLADGETRMFSRGQGPTVTLFACVTKGSRWDWTVEKAVELGVDRIVPVISARTIVRIPKTERPAKRERWMRIAEDAARQSDAVFLPRIEEAIDFGDSLALAAASRCFVGALTNPPPPAILAAVMSMPAEPPASNDVSVFIGPEGDFAPEELDSLLKVAEPVSLGPTILRAETAAIFALSVLVATRAG